MNAKLILLTLALGASTCLLTAQDNNPPPDGQRPPPRAGGPGGPGGPGGLDRPGGPGPGGFHLLPPRAQEQLKLTPDQRKQLADLEAEVKAKMEKILTPEQLQQLKQLRPMPPQGGPGRQGGPGGFNQGPGPGGPDRGGPRRGPGGQGGPDGQGRPPGPPQDQ